MKNNNLDYQEIKQLMMDKKFRQTVKENPALALKQLNYEGLDKGISVKFIENTKTKYYVVFWQHTEKFNESLEGISAAAATSSTLGTGGSLGTLGTATTSASTASTIGCVGTAGSAQ